MIKVIIYHIVFLGLLYLIYIILLKKEKNLKLNRIYLLISLFFCFASPFLQFDYGFSWDPIHTIVNESDLGNNTFDSPSITYENLEVVQYKSALRDSAITTIYITISLLMLLRFLWNLKNIYYSIKKSKRVKYKDKELIIAEDAVSPYSFFNYIFLRPKLIENETELESILMHENCHSQQYHSFDIIMIQFMMCFGWFNPFVWLFKKEIETNHEFLADSFVINSGIDVDFYSTLIVNQSKNNIPEIYSGFGLIKTKSRLNMLHQQKSSILKNGLKVSFALILCASVFVLSSSTNIREGKSFIVVIDPGHGGEDEGNLTEKKINLEIAIQLLELSKGSNIKILSTRNSDEFMSIEDRVDFVNKIKPDLLLSIHCNTSKNSKQNGVEGYYSLNNPFNKASKSFTEILVQKQLANKNISGNIKSTNFKIIKNPKVPSVLLQLGFLTNDTDLKRLRDKKQQEIIANRILDGLKLISTISN